MPKLLKNLFIIIIAIAAAVAVSSLGKIVGQPTKEQEQHNGATTEKYVDEKLGFSFEYKKGLEGYTLKEEEISGSGDYHPEKILILINTTDYEDFIASDIPREGPMAISVGVYDNFNNLSAEDWVIAWPRISVYDLALAPMSPVSLGGVAGVRYTTDGLYRNDSVVVAQNSKIFIFSGSYNSSEDSMKKDFEELLKTVKFF